MKETPETLMCDQKEQAMKDAVNANQKAQAACGGALAGQLGRAVEVRRSVRLEADQYEALQRNVEVWRVDEVVAALVNSASRTGITQFTVTVK